MTTVRCKFKVDSVAQYPHGVSLTMSPVYSTDPNHENKRFWDATPSGKFEMHVNNVDAVAHMKPGQEFYIDITPA